MFLFVNFKDISSNKNIKISYDEQRKIIKILLVCGYNYMDNYLIVIHDVEDKSITNENVILKGYSVFWPSKEEVLKKYGLFRGERDVMVFAKTEKMEDSIYVLLLEGEKSHIPFLPKNSNSLYVRHVYHIDQSWYANGWFVHLHCLMCLQMSCLFGFSIPRVTENSKSIIYQVVEKNMAYFYEFTKTTVNSKTVWCFQKIEAINVKSTRQYTPVVSRCISSLNPTYYF